MPAFHEWMFYEVMWRLWARGRPYPFPFWMQQYFRRWTDGFDGGLFDSKEAAFASNASYRYWNMIGEPDQDLESLVGQAGEVEPIYDEYTVGAFLFEPTGRRLHFPQRAGEDGTSTLRQELVDGWKPVVRTVYRSGGLELEQKAFATGKGGTDKSWITVRLRASRSDGRRDPAWLCVSLSALGPTGFKRHDSARPVSPDRRLSMIRYLPAERRVETNVAFGPSFSVPPSRFGLYGNGSSDDPEFYLQFNPYQELAEAGALNGLDLATDYRAGLCHGVFAWELPEDETLGLDVMLPLGRFDTVQDLGVMTPGGGDVVAEDGATWETRLFSGGMVLDLPPALAQLETQYALSRSQLLILADRGEIHPGPTIYDSFWIRDSSVEGIAVALAGDEDLAETQFGTHYKRVFNQDRNAQAGGVPIAGFFGGEHERNDLEWDANGQALWAFGRFDRIKGCGYGFGAGIFQPYVLDAARWLRDNRSPFGLLPSGWSAEHLGDKGKPHYWDDLWAVGGLWEAARMAERVGAPAAQRDELWRAHDDVARATRDSILWTVARQREQGFWETFVPTGPADVGRLDSTIVGAVAYFHPCRLYMGSKLGPEVDRAMRLTLETIHGRFARPGFRHDAAWNAFGPYLTLQLAHAFLLVGDAERCASLLDWAVRTAANPLVTHGPAGNRWQVVQGAWNEQHCYPLASDFAEFPAYPWYMGDMPHGWACAELILLLRDMVLFEADEDQDPTLFLFAGILPRWLDEGERVAVENARTVFGERVNLSLTHRRADRRLEIAIDWSDARVRYLFPCRFGAVLRVSADGQDLPVPADGIVALPAGTRRATVEYGA